MKVVSWNVRGMGNPERRMVIKEVLRINKVQIALLQESKLRIMSDRIVKEVWGGRFIKWGAKMLWVRQGELFCCGTPGLLLF